MRNTGVRVCLENVLLEYPVYNARSFSLRHKLVNVATGGMVMGKTKGVTTVRALSDVNMDIRAGDRAGIIGHNGSGKTTLLRCITGVYKPTQGRVSCVGSVGSYIEISAGLEPELSGYDNIERLLRLRGIYKKQAIHALIDDIIEFSELGDFIHLPVRTYSMGMQTRLVFAAITATTPDIMVMDEFFSAGDKRFQDKATQRLTHSLDQASIVIIASHDHALIQNFCDRYFMLNRGAITELSAEEMSQIAVETAKKKEKEERMPNLVQP